MRLIHRVPFSTQEIESYRQLVFNNLTHGLHSVINAMEDMELSVSEENQELVHHIEDAADIKDGEPFRFVGTNAYWLPSLNSDKDINTTLQTIADAGIKVVRTWAFNDVPTIPQNGTWFQLIANGTTQINTGANGLQKLDTVVELARQKGLLLILSLTNNWNPLPLIDGTETTNVDVENALRRRDVTVGTNNSLLRNTLSNDYGASFFRVHSPD